MKNFKLYGKYADQGTKEQVDTIKKSPAFAGETIAVMPDNHLGKGACIGLTSTVNNGKIIPNVVGVDLGCGMAKIELTEPFATEYKNDKVEALQKVQTIIRNFVPHGMGKFGVHEDMSHLTNDLVDELDDMFNELSFNIKERDKRWIRLSLGSLGGGNHFIEIDEAKDGKLYLIIHTGSRSLGKLVAEHHQKLAEKNFLKAPYTQEELDLVPALERKEWIENKNKEFLKNAPVKGLEYLEGDQANEYIADSKIAQAYAKMNRQMIIWTLANQLGIKKYKITETVHNAVGTTTGGKTIIRKGAVYADPNNDIIIPLNMRDGVIIARGKDNKEANYSAPHGAGRLMSRNEANKKVKLEDYVDSMKDIVSWTVNVDTIDESPFAYKPKEEIIEGLKDLVVIVEILKPVFNFKDDNPKKPWKKKNKKNSK